MGALAVAGVLVAFWRLTTATIVWNVFLWSTGRRVAMGHVRQAFVPGAFFGLNLAIFMSTICPIAALAVLPLAVANGDVFGMSGAGWTYMLILTFVSGIAANGLLGLLSRCCGRSCCWGRDCKGGSSSASPSRSAGCWPSS